MPTFAPTLHTATPVGPGYVLWFVKEPSAGDDQGVIVQKPDGSFWHHATPGFGEWFDGTSYAVGRRYYLSLAEARQAIGVDGIHGISYVDDFNDEYQDYYVCDLAVNTPGHDAHTPELTG
jgi:hypothetical protein